MTETLTASLARLPVTLRDIEAAAGVLAGFVKRTNFDPQPHAVRHHRRQRLAQVRKPAVHGDVQGARGAQPARCLVCRRAAAGRDRRLGWQPRRRAWPITRPVFSVPATIFVPVATPTVKIENTRRHGANVIEAGSNPGGSRYPGDGPWSQGAVDVHPSLR